MRIRNALVRLWWPATVAVVVLALDQMAKILTVRTWPTPQTGEIPLLGSWLSLTYIRNTGIAFGLFQGVPQFFTLTSLVIVAGAIYYFLRHAPASDRLLPVVLGLIVGGALSNVVDRLRLGYVVDFIKTFAGRFPVFNLGDTAVVTGVGLLMLHTFLNERRSHRYAEQVKQEQQPTR